MNPNFSAKLSYATASALLLTAFAAVAFAGPSAPSTVRPGAKLFDQSTPAPGCTGCKTTPVIVAKTVGIPNKGQTEWTKVGTKHECAFCSGATMAKVDGTSEGAIRDAVKCGPMMCCATAKK